MSLGNLLLQVADRRRQFSQGANVCQAVICLNESMREAAAHEPVVRVVDCATKEFIEYEGVQYCRRCWTPRSGGQHGS